MLKIKIIEKIDTLLEEARNIPPYNDVRFDYLVDHSSFVAFKASCLNFLEKTVTPNNIFYTLSVRCLDSGKKEEIEGIVRILNNFRNDVSEGWLGNLQGIISAEIFSDFLEMASYLLDEYYKDAAAVMVGSVLEEHLRQLCNKNEIEITVEKSGKLKSKTASLLNDELKAKGIYNLLNQKSVTGWLDLRNCAAHGKYNQYELSQVKNMLEGVRCFIISNPS